ncbi:MAG: hypothetical protein J5932_11165 [Prevotella sp.]|nr:hypothetical protein [Prevotella sp.]
MKKIILKFQEFFRANPVMALFVVVLMLFYLSQLAWTTIRDDPRYAHIRIGVEQGLSVDSIMKLKQEMEFQGYVEHEILGDSLQSN